MATIQIRGARVHNLKNISLDLPRDKLTVFTGPSGSGKSSLAFDTLYAEGQRRYLSTLSTTARQFLEQLPKPEVDSIDGLSPAIAIDQQRGHTSPRSTVGTTSEILDYLRLLFARRGQPHCPTCERPIEAQSASEIVDQLLRLPVGSRLTLLAPIARERRSSLTLELDRLRREGFVRVRIDGSLVELGDEIVLDPKHAHDLDVVIDRIVLKESEGAAATPQVVSAEKVTKTAKVAPKGTAKIPAPKAAATPKIPAPKTAATPKPADANGQRSRLSDSVELALRWGEGSLLLDCNDGQPARWLSERFACLHCKLSFPALEAQALSFNNLHGACTHCKGLGVEPRSVAPANVANEGADDNAVEDPESEILLSRSASYALRIPERCGSCQGARLAPFARAVRWRGHGLHGLCTQPLDALQGFLHGLQPAPSSPWDSEVEGPLLQAISERVDFLVEVGLGYLTIDRTMPSLSGGEAQRIRLATQLGARLSGVLYVLDEPSSGLHPADLERLLKSVRHLVNQGNTVVMVEHDRDAILAADFVVDMGPRAGVGGGQVLATGSPIELAKNPQSPTGAYLRESQAERELPLTADAATPAALAGARRRASNKRTLAARAGTPEHAETPSGPCLQLTGARLHNLKSVTITIPLHQMTVFTGPSGSGKSTLVHDTLRVAIAAKNARFPLPSALCDSVDGAERIQRVLAVDQGSIGRTPRSNPASFLGIFGELRELYAELPEARARGFRAGRFSFNVKGGRCEVCRGEGLMRVNLQFLPDAFVRCEACRGRRYHEDTLAVRYRGLSIADTLDLTASEALSMFEPYPKLRALLGTMERVGLGYLQLGQAATTLSGGEAQRLRLARELARAEVQGDLRDTLILLDEPTTGLHFHDVDVLLDALFALRERRATIVVVEHNLDFAAHADWIIDMGPGPGQAGGQVIAAGPPARVATHPASPTAPFLRQALRHMELQQS